MNTETLDSLAAPQSEKTPITQGPEHLISRLRHHVTGSIERGESQAIVEIPRMKSKLELKAEKLLRIDSRRKAHNAALSMLHASPLKACETHETRGLKMWRKLRRIEAVAHDAATAQCNGERYGSQPFREDNDDPLCAWDQFAETIREQVAAVFGYVGYSENSLPGFCFNQDPRGYALKLDPEKCTIPQGMVADWGGYGILAAEINE